MKWVEDIFPDNQQWKSFSRNLVSMSQKIGDSIELDPRLKQMGEDKLAEWRSWFDSRLDDAIEAAATQENPEIESE